MDCTETNIVRKCDERPARMDGTCFYCSKPIGEPHNDGCVARRKTVVVDFTIRLIRRVPADWTKEDIEFSANESSWCASNLIEEIKQIAGEGGCICNRTTGQFIREATADDEQELGVPND